MFTTLVLVALLTGALVHAAPIDDGIQPEPSYVSSPRGRGTLDLLFTCVITLLICIWTAIHPDILPKPTLRNRLKDKAWYVMIGLFSPEIVLAMAFNQWRKARLVLTVWRRCAALDVLKEEVDKAAREVDKNRRTRTNRTQGTSETAQGSHLSIIRTEPTKQIDAEAMDQESAMPEKDATKSIVNETMDGEDAELEELQYALYEAKMILKKHDRIDYNPTPPRTRTRQESNQNEGNPGRAATRWIPGFVSSWMSFVKRYASRLINSTGHGRQDNEVELKNDEDLDEVISAKKTVRKEVHRYHATKRIQAAKMKSKARGVFRWCVEAVQQSRQSKDEFGMQDAFFAVMGGYTSKPFNPYEHREYESALSAETLVALLRAGIITPKALANLKTEVKDKGKSNMLAKFLVCGQASWMAINCLLRKRGGLPITIIELNVMVHVLIAVSVYVCWWKKPHDAGTGISLTGRTLDKHICAVLYVLQQNSLIELYASTDAPYNLELKSADFLQMLPPDANSEEQKETPSTGPDATEKPVNSLDQSGKATSSRPTDPTASPESKTEAAAIKDTPEIEEIRDSMPPIYERHQNGLRKVVIPREVVEKWRDTRELVLESTYILVNAEGGFAVGAPLPSEDRSTFTTTPPRITIKELHLEIYKDAAVAMRRQANSKFVDTLPGDDHSHPIKLKQELDIQKKGGQLQAKEMFWVLIPLCLLYGGLHASLWNSYFPTPAERLLWRISSVVVSIPGLGVGAIWGINQAAKSDSMIRDPKKLGRLLKVTGKGLLGSLGTMLVLILTAIPLAAAGGVIYGTMLAHPRILGLKVHIIVKLIIWTQFYPAVAVTIIGCLSCSLAILGSFAEGHGELTGQLILGFSYAISFVCVIAYCSARAFILVETFICLRSLPPGSYKTVRFEEWWPHI